MNPFLHRVGNLTASIIFGAAIAAVSLTLPPRAYAEDTPPAGDSGKAKDSPPAGESGDAKSSPSEGDKKPTAKAAELHYGWEPNKIYQYEVLIEAHLADTKLTYRGTSTYRVAKATGGQVTLVHQGQMQESDAGRPPAAVAGPGAGRMSGPRGAAGRAAAARAAAPHRPPHQFGGRPVTLPQFAEHELTISPRGSIIKLTGQTQLPFMLGDLALLTVEPLADKAEPMWAIEYALTLTERKSAQPSQIPRHGPSRFAAEEPPKTQRPGTELVAYHINDVKDGTATITKRSWLKTAKEADGGVVREQFAQGDLEFDVKRGVFTKGVIKYSNKFEQSNVIVKVPVEVRYRLLDEAELARRAEEHKAVQEKMAADRAKSDEEAARPLSDDEARQFVTQLSGSDKRLRREAAQKLSKRTNTTAHQEEISRALESLLSDPDNWAKQSGVDALKTWGTVANVPALVKLTAEDNHFVRARAIEALGPLRNKQAAEAVAALLIPSETRGDARKSLEQMGVVAEPYVVPLLDDREEGVRSEACHVLSVIGTAASREKLEKLAIKPRGNDAGAAREALEKIASRQ